MSLIQPDATARVALRRDIVVSASFQARFRIERLLGAGGSSTVYLAHDVTRARPVAIKILTRLESRIDRERFAREMDYLRRVDHVNVISLLETGVEAGHPYIVMDYSSGGSLRRLMRTHGRLPLTQAIDVAMDLLAGLEALHAQGLVHRDLKPDNILLDHAGRAHIADLGIAYDVAQGDPACYEPGSLIGTPRYMAPEQALGQPSLPAADLYGVGLMLFEMLAGDPPFLTDSADDLLTQHVHQPAPDIRSRVPWAPEPLAALIAAALSKSPAARPPSAALFRQALARCRPATGPAISRPTYRLAIDREVLVRAQSSARSAVELLYHEYASLVRAYLLRATGPLGLRARTFAVFKIAHDSIPKTPVSFAHWLLRIAAHVADA